VRTRNSDKQQLVKQKAIERLSEHGFQGFSMNKLAAACGISVATLYIYYKDKDDLIKTIGNEIGKQFMSKSLEGFSPKMNFAEGLKKQWENRAAFALQYPKEIACYEIIRHSSEVEFIVEESFTEFKTIMGEFCRNAVKRKELVPLSVDVFWSVAYGPLYTLLGFHQQGKSIGGRPFKFSKQKMEEAFQQVIKALTP
jgi:TetR/AcrR family transcriptional regulator, multidrug resistance operon repressor